MLMELQITLLGGPYIKNAKSTWKGSYKAARPKEKYYGKKLGSFTLKAKKGKFVLTPEQKEYLELREKLNFANMHVCGIEIAVI